MTPINQYSGDGRRQAFRPFATKDDTHAGLWLDKYLNVLNPQSEGEKSAIRDLIKSAASIHIPVGYSTALQRREDALRQLDGGVQGGITHLLEAKTRGRLVVGLGTESLRETNLTLEHTWGVPVIPGSALKGVAAHAAHLHGGPEWKQGNEDQPGGEHHEVLFGNTEYAGYVTFHDAWWIPGRNDSHLPLDLDIMTVHHSDYYGGDNAAPADWDDPNPVAFMTTRGTFLVALSGPDAWVARAAEWLTLALEHHGIGGKTRAGYGRMKLKPR